MERDDLHELTAGYALDALEPAEEAEYEAHLGRCPECRDELASLQEAGAELAFAAAGPAPPPDLRGRILDAARSERASVTELPRRWPLRVAVAAAAVAATIAVVLGVWAASLLSDLDAEQEARAEQELAAEVLADPGSERYRVDGSPGTLVVAPDGGAVLVLSDLAGPPGEMVYKSWVSPDGETFEPAAAFEGSGEQIVWLDHDVPPGGLVAVTIEEEPDVTAPGSDPIFTAQTS